MPTYFADMTASGTSNNTYRHEVIADLIQQDIPGNRSQIRVRQQIKKTSSFEAWNTNKTSTRSVSCTGMTTNSETFGYDFRGKANGYIQSYFDSTFWVNHNSDGSKTLTISANMNLTGMKSSANIGAKSWTLPKIPRGPRVNHNGTWKHSTLYVNHGGTWKTAIPYVNHNGTWKIGAN